jgi:hypothetical protein
MDNASKRQRLEQIVAKRREALRDNAALDPQLRALSQSDSRHLLPPRPPSRSSMLPLALFALVGAVALIACAATATLVVVGGSWLQRTLSDPTTTVQNFYGALQQKDYAGAYGYFSATARAHMTEAQFEDQFAGYDTLDGLVSGYSIGAPHTLSGGEVSVTVTVTRAAAASGPQVHTLILVRESGAWRINSLSVRLSLATPPPRK